MGWDPCLHQCTWDGWGRGPRSPKEAMSCWSQPLSHTWTDFLVLAVTGKVGRAVGWRPVEQQVGIDGHISPASHAHSGPSLYPARAVHPPPRPCEHRRSALGCGRVSGTSWRVLVNAPWLRSHSRVRTSLSGLWCTAGSPDQRVNAVPHALHTSSHSELSKYPPPAIVHRF